MSAAPPPILYRPMVVADHAALVELLRTSPGVTLRDADSAAAVARYLARNPGLSYVALADDALVGVLMAGHDGRRGYLQHLIVVPAHRRRGIGATLIAHCLGALAAEGIAKSHVEVLADNAEGLAYWARRGWIRRDDLVRFSYVGAGGENA